MINFKKYSAKNMNKKQKILNDLKILLNKNFSDQIAKIILYGSQIDHNHKKNSDYDILIILKKQYDWKLKNRIYDLLYEIDLKHDIVTDIKIISLEELETIRGKLPYIQNALQYGIQL